MRISRFRTIGISALQGAILPFSGLITASLGIYLFGIESWGKFVFIQLTIFPITLVCNWGSRNFLIKELSLDPAKIGKTFLTNLASRAFLLPLSLTLFILLPFKTAALSVLIIIVQFFYLSYDGPTVFTESFIKRISAEILGLVCFVIGLTFISEFDVNLILAVQSGVLIIKSIYLSIALKGLQLFKAKPSFKLGYTLKFGFPFFAIGLSGWLQSKSDLYMLTILEGSRDIAAYQIVIGGLSVIQAIIGFLIEPLIKFVYRSKEGVIKGIGAFVFKIGVPIIILGLVTLALILEWLAPNRFDVYTYLFGLLYLIPFLIFMPSIFKLYKANKERRVVYVSVFSAGVNLLLTWLFIPTLGLNGALLGSALSQIVMLILFRLLVKSTHSKAYD
ncbi:MAG: O-antigen/teichoic acid export membrane protein [Roseivirga sp.]|jgi:O-antigen/teichoic acid export membrane protein